MNLPFLFQVALFGQGSLAASVVSPAALLGGMGLILGLGLAYAARKMAVPRDPKVQEVDRILPGANCGGCGYPGCTQFAEAVCRGEAPPDGCVAASDEINRQIAEVVGKEISEGDRLIALVHCNGGHSAGEAFEYLGPPDCVSADMVMGGQKICSFACLGFGDCAEACPFDAIEMGDNGVPVVDRGKCTGCGVCLEACPKDIIELWPVSREVVVSCSSRDRGGPARKACTVACIACGKCVRVCPVDAVSIEDFLAVIDPAVCINCGLCAAECPTGAITDHASPRPKAYIDGSCVGCTLCAKVCPAGAITGELKERHTVDMDKCVGCGLCVPKCPKGSINLIGARSRLNGRDRTK